ncbi:hypothetical protein BH24ACI3_BH24ACI3_12860 [soil metagenome]
MQVKLRDEIDADFAENYVSVTDYMSGPNKYEINCGICNKTLYADKETSERIFRSIEEGLDNPFLCIDCEKEYDELAFEDR